VANRIDAVDIAALHEALRRFTASLEVHRDELDSLNVFPVPDGDTGTNLVLTMREVMTALDDLGDPSPDEGFGSAVASAALMAARGNSGVILAQVLRTLAGRLESSPGDGAALAGAYREAAGEARRAVARPVEGTVLTVLGDGAAAAEASAARGGDVATVAASARDAAAESLARTTDALPELAEAGVVDAGGLGALLLLDAMASVTGGVETTVAVGPAGPVGFADRDEQDVGFKFEVMYLLLADDALVPDLRERLGTLGDSLVVVGSGGLYKVHLHTDEPEAAIAAAADAGVADDVRVVDLEEQVAEQCFAGQARGVRVGERAATALVAVAEGEGIARLFRSLGAVVVPGPNPSTGDLVEAAEAAPADAVVVLPNDPAVIPVSERAAGESGKDVWVVRTRTVPEGLSAATAFNPTAAPPDAAEHMAEAAAAVTTARLIRVEEGAAAVHDAPPGSWVAVTDGDVEVADADLAHAAFEVLSLLRTGDHEILTILAGAGVSDAEARNLADLVEARDADLQVELHRGDQPGEAYLFGLE
jgi:DAK2 domain fusion protein YloV